jgi:hypothetical protein
MSGPGGSLLANTFRAGGPAPAPPQLSAPHILPRRVLIEGRATGGIRRRVAARRLEPLLTGQAVDEPFHGQRWRPVSASPSREQPEAQIAGGDPQAATAKDGPQRLIDTRPISASPPAPAILQNRWCCELAPTRKAAKPCASEALAKWSARDGLAPSKAVQSVQKPIDTTVPATARGACPDRQADIVGSA